MTDTKICTTCGQEKPLNEFRNYPRDTTARYPYCLECQTIETRRKYLVSKIENRTNTLEEELELVQIEDLYKLRLDKGLKTLGTRSKHKSVRHLVDKQAEFLKTVNERK